jgi:ankyrin repeat protein
MLFWNSVVQCIDLLFDTTTEHQQTFDNACKTGNIHLVNILLEFEFVDPSADDNYAIRVACSCGHISVVDRLLHEDSDPSADDNYAIRIASENGHIDVVDRLLQDNRVEPRDVNNNAIFCAITNGHVAVVDRLLQCVHPFTINIAINYKHKAIIEFLIQDPRVTHYCDKNLTMFYTK